MPLDPETLEQLLRTVRRFVREKLVPLEQRASEENEVPGEAIAEMRALGLFGFALPKAYGGLGLSIAEEALLVFELGWTSPAFRSVFGTNNGIGGQGLVMDGTEAQKDRYLPRLASGELISCFALTEPEAGSDAGALTTSAVRKGDTYVLNGTKRFITNAPRADLFTVFARTDKNTPGSKGVSAFLVERAATGLSIGAPDRKMGQHGTQTADVIMEDCVVPAEALLGGVEGRGFATAMKVLDRGRLHMGAMCVGMAERLLHESIAYARAREQFGKPIAEFQLVQAMIADTRTELLAARSMVMDTARRKDAGENISTEASCCKLFATEMVGRAADRAVQIHGGAGYMADYAVERFYRDVRLVRLYEGTSEIQRLIIARNLLRDAAEAD